MKRPTAAKGTFPYPHRTVALVDAEERYFSEARARAAIASERASGLFLAPIDRSPCPRCGIRSDIGCKHKRKGTSFAHVSIGEAA